MNIVSALALFVGLAASAPGGAMTVPPVSPPSQGGILYHTISDNHVPSNAQVRGAIFGGNANIGYKNSGQGNIGAFNGGSGNIGALNGIGNVDATSGNNNIGGVNGSFNTGQNNGNGNIGGLNGNFNGGSGNGNNNIGFGNGNFNGNFNRNP